VKERRTGVGGTSILWEGAGGGQSHKRKNAKEMRVIQTGSGGYLRETRPKTKTPRGNPLSNGQVFVNGFKLKKPKVLKHAESARRWM